MNRRDQVLQALSEASVAMKTADIATMLNTVEQNIHKVVRELADEGLVNQVGVKPFTYLLSATGRDRLADPTFGQSARARKSIETDEVNRALKVGVFTSGELQIEVGGKRLVLSSKQASHLVEFLDALPHKLFVQRSHDRPSPFAALGVGVGRVHRLADDA